MNGASPLLLPGGTHEEHAELLTARINHTTAGEPGRAVQLDGVVVEKGDIEEPSNRVGAAPKKLQG